MMTDELKEEINSLIEQLDEEKPPSSIKEADKAIKTNLLVYLRGYVADDFWYNGWKDGPKNKFDSARVKLMERLVSEIKETPFIPLMVEESESNSAFEFDVKEIREDVLTLQDYLEMNE
ncbi:MAG: hypothetical protein GOVbin556_23 [Prokaryotic dsDNA virus sp.]|nr:MAG: hypothetical protein GOVbin556_23 [Prokaryotic dsDNA virus sp.]|tara:strand:- start:77 stop:433 length:357 start_codon:yes stop_codon:yes gene_type:complete